MLITHWQWFEYENIEVISNWCDFCRYRLQFDRESKAEIEARKKAAQEPLKYIAQVCVSLILTFLPDFWCTDNILDVLYTIGIFLVISYAVSEAKELVMFQ